MNPPVASQQTPNTTLTLSASEHALIHRTVLPSGLRMVTETLPGSTTSQWTAVTVADVNAAAEERCGAGAAVVEAVHGPIPTNALDD